MGSSSAENMYSPRPEILAYLIPGDCCPRLIQFTNRGQQQDLSGFFLISAFCVEAGVWPQEFAPIYSTFSFSKPA